MSECRAVIGLRDDNSDANRSVRLTLTLDVALVITLPFGFIFAPDPTGITSLFLIAGLTAVSGLPMHFGLSRVSGSKL